MTEVKLSHSSTSRYLKCPKSYELHYQKKIRPTVSSAALFFGSALDEAFNTILLKSGDAKEVFISKWSKAFINRTLVELPKSTQIVYAVADCDADLLTKQDEQLLQKHLEDLKLDDYLLGSPIEILKQVQAFKKQVPHRVFRYEEFSYLNYASWLSMARKGVMILDEYAKSVLPRINKVIAVQKTIEITNDDGDKITGVVDLIAEWEDGKTYILDNKTSARLYDEDAVYYNPQLALYAFSESINNGGFIVCLKNLKKDKSKICTVCGHDGSESRAKTCDAQINGKRCSGDWKETVKPRSEIQVVLGEIPKIAEEIVVDNFNQVNKGIKSNFFPRNLSSCDDWYGGPCPYKGLCWANKTDGLETVE